MTESNLLDYSRSHIRVNTRANMCSPCEKCNRGNLLVPINKKIFLTPLYGICLSLGPSSETTSANGSSSESFHLKEGFTFNVLIQSYNTLNEPVYIKNVTEAEANERNSTIYYWSLHFNQQRAALCFFTLDERFTGCFNYAVTWIQRVIFCKYAFRYIYCFG